ncbi:D-alanyl-D-alanine carboxypeptidase/D-alanyl-D-alanine-endopeptidase [Nitrogeniibacter mangrovi]|uniref:D-alanyl-D-alanine carboxypeptidase/D-alanyl-D-alanine-endopeptidase n=1 Tax=Nitrogeniibacter mangrovi TaxID=2016596 RepID=A0A6C1B1G8_9RHOO|nr:D-alanyl-D-alanine carboxypeptidase/D-alanyl-D-alanine-endopeptidase [Nitrogeniibacter mangrovi]QID16755.1 D-alanyl-D-alanine carboxypeptidase/D-alanyl-D-alanine-endopeptidase [Nitrogeniibacter mangrovi]
MPRTSRSIATPIANTPGARPSRQHGRPLVLCLLLLLPLLAHAAGFPADLKKALERANIPLSDVAVWVSRVDKTRPTLSHNPDLPMNPASVMKLVTTFATLDRLGPAYYWTTRLKMDGHIHNHTLEGNLYLVGGGDPVFTHADLWKLMRQMRELGVQQITGDIVLDDSALRLPPHDPGAFDGQALRPYNAGPSGLMINFNALRLTFVPEPAPVPAGPPVQLVSAANAAPAAAVPTDPRPPRILVDPPMAGLDLDSAVRTVDGHCARRWYKALDAEATSERHHRRLSLKGTWRDDCGIKDWFVSPESPEDFARDVVGGLWKELGGRLDGKVRQGLTPDGLPTLFVHTSRPLADVVRDMNKWSNNVIARQLLATLGASDNTAPDMVAGGARLASVQLAAAGIDTTGLSIENGAGLSRTARITVRTLGQLLEQAWARPFMPEFISSMAVAGIDGTARRRLRDSPAQGTAHIKTGTLNGVRAMAGYVIDRKGQRHVVAMLVNHPNAGASREAQDILLEWVWEGH